MGSSAETFPSGSVSLRSGPRWPFSRWCLT